MCIRDRRFAEFQSKASRDDVPNNMDQMQEVNAGTQNQKSEAKKTYKLGQPIRVEVSGADKLTRTVDFLLSRDEGTFTGSDR